ncbi:type II secretion system protein F [Escherichia coli]|uniref:Type II secretion system protein F n=1 Tax=Escherichia coli TaxID=562 RepID=A0A376VD14_ECOLX|nr:type II secretion system protein F [Escherichia coli]
MPRQLLRGKDLIPVHIEARMNASAGGMLQRRRHAHRRVAAADLALFTRQLATLVQAAMPLETCLQAVSEQSEKLHVKSLGMALRSRIQEGYTLSDSLREHPRVFDSLFCSDGRCRRKIRTSRRGAQSPGGLHRTAASV